MGHEAKSKHMRHQLRQIVQEELPAVLKTEILVDSGRKCAELTKSHMEDVAKQAAKDIEKIDSQTQGFRSMALRDLGSQISNELYEMNCTMLAWQEVITDHLKTVSIEIADLQEKIKEKKVTVKSRLQKEAREAEMEERRLNKIEKEKQAKAKEELEAKAQDNPENLSQNEDSGNISEAAGDSA